MIRPLLRKNLYDQNITVKEKNAKQMTCRLVREEGMFSGISTGANVLASIQLAKESGKGSKIVTVAVDTGLISLDRTLPQNI